MSIHPSASSGSMKVGRFTVTYHDTGSANDGRQPIVLLHGTGGAAATHFRTLFPMLAARHRVLAIDWDVENTATLEDLVFQVHSAIAERVNGPVHLAGYSLGAVVAAALAAQYPNSAITLTMLAGWLRTDEQQRLRRSVSARLRSLGAERAMKEFATYVTYSPSFIRQCSASELEDLISRRQSRQGIEIEDRINDQVDLRGEAAKITTPTLVVGGTADSMVPLHHAHLLFGAIEDCRMAEITTGHAMTTERPAQIFKLIDDFVGDPQAVTSGGRVANIKI